VTALVRDSWLWIAEQCARRWRRADAGAYWIGMLGFALAAPAATERAVLICDDASGLCSADDAGIARDRIRRWP
jgi:hypothetical protein